MLGYGQNELLEFLDGIIGVYSCRRSANSERLISNAGIKAGTKENGAVQNRPNSLIGMAPHGGHSAQLVLRAYGGDEDSV